MSGLPAIVPPIPKKTSATSSQINYDDLVFDKRIGSGGYADVYLGKYGSTQVAIKKIRVISSEEEKDTFFREICNLSELKNPNLLQFIGYTIEPTWCIITHYVPGGSLYDSLRSKDSLTDTELQIIAYGIANGMSYLHAKDYIHRDLKSQNVLLDENKYPVVCDFGSSKRKQTLRSLPGQIGTVNYMAPEFLNSKKHDEKVDVYSFGILLWELVTKENPFSGMTSEQVICAVILHDRRPTLPDDILGETEALIVNCWDKDPKKRTHFSLIVDYLKENMLFKNVNKEVFAQYVANSTPSRQTSARGIRTKSARPFTPSFIQDSEPIDLKERVSMLQSCDESEFLDSLKYFNDHFEEVAFFPVVKEIIPTIFYRLTKCNTMNSLIVQLTSKLIRYTQLLIVFADTPSLHSYVCPATFDVFNSIVSSPFADRITVQVVDELFKLVNSEDPDVSYKSIFLLCRISNIIMDYDLNSRLRVHLPIFANINGGYLVLRHLHHMSEVIDEAIICIFIRSNIKSNIIGGYDLFLAMDKSMELIDLNSVLDHMLQKNQDVDLNLSNITLDIIYRFHKEIPKEHIPNFIYALIECVQNHLLRNASLLLCLLSEHITITATMIKKIIGMIIPSKNSESSVYIMKYVAVLCLKHNFFSEIFNTIGFSKFIKSVLDRNEGESYCLVFTLLYKYPGKYSSELKRELIDDGVIDSLLVAVLTAPDSSFLDFTAKTIYKVIPFGFIEKYKDLAGLITRKLSEHKCYKSCIHLAHQLLMYKEVRDSFIDLNLANVLICLEDLPEELGKVRRIIYDALITR